jgi:hypothetical protein
MRFAYGCEDDAFRLTYSDGLGNVLATAGPVGLVRYAMKASA